jgi:hypothetical protein
MEESMTSDRRAPALAEERIKIAIHYSQRGRTMRRIPVTTIGMLMTMCAATAHADVVTDWNQIAIDMLKAANVAVNPWSRSMAMMHVAMSDAINTVQGRYTTYTAKLPAAPNASAEAAAVSAARHILIQLLPAQRAKIDEAYADSLARLPDGAAKNDGITLGERVAALVQADRSTDATNVPDTYRPITTPGVWIPTQPPSFAEYAQAKPWGMKSADQFRPGPPPPLSSALYARDYNETKDLGGAKSVKRTAQQTEAVRFWTTGNFLPSWNQVARQLSAAKGLGLAENARLFALLNMGIANNYICDWDAKFHYNRWRPVTAIRNGDQDGNDATERDAGWTPLNTTPMHPEYPSSAAIVAGVSSGVLESVFGTGSSQILTVTDSADPRLQRQFNSIGQMAEEQRMVRIWGGIHFRNSLEVSEQMGRKLAEHLVSNIMRPVR